MQLTIVSDGVHLSQKDGCFVLRKGDKKKKISPQRVTSILLCNRCQLTSQVLVLAMEHNIDVLLLNHYGDPVGRFWYGRHGRSVITRRAQISTSQTLQGVLLSAPWLTTKVKNQALFLKQLLKSRPKQDEQLSPYLLQIEYAEEELTSVLESIAEGAKVDMDTLRARLMGIEGSASRAYFRCISEILPANVRFKTRSRRPALDAYNAALNYAYGILYGKIERACLLAGLDPFAGFLHADHPYRPALVCDLIEPFRIWAERVVTFLFTRRKLNTSHVTKQATGVLLNASGKEILVPALQEHMEEKVRIFRRHIPRGMICMHEAHRLANALITENPHPKEWFLEHEEF